MQVVRRFCFMLGVLLLLMGTSNAGLIESVNVGAGFMWNDSIRQRFESAGGISLHTSVHVKPPGPFMLTPFYDVNFASPFMQMLGVGLNYRVSMRDFETHILFFGPNIGIVLSDGVSQRFIGGEVGYKFPIGEKLGLFSRVKYIEDQNDVVSGFSGHVGVVFKLFQ